MDTLGRLQASATEYQKNGTLRLKSSDAKQQNIIERFEKGNFDVLLENSDTHLKGIPLLDQILLPESMKIVGVRDPFRRYYFGLLFVFLSISSPSNLDFFRKGTHCFRHQKL